MEPKVKITLYCLALFFGSLVFDLLPVPRTYMGRKDNVFNLYFVKIGWAWLLFVVGSFVYLTSCTYGCGRRDYLVRHMGRLAVGTVLWAGMTGWLFRWIEGATGNCIGRPSLTSKWSCVTSGHHWHAFDISGHAFILIFMNLITMEEAGAIVGWEGLKEAIFHEEHRRGEEGEDKDGRESALRGLTHQEFTVLKEHYTQYTPYIRVFFVLMTLLSLLCDVCLACTVVYFHTMPQKVVGGGLAMALWYATYRATYPRHWPGLPGEGPFRYRPSKAAPVLRRKQTVITTKDNQPVPMFMGMPLYGAVSSREKTDRTERGSGETDRT